MGSIQNHVNTTSVTWQDTAANYANNIAMISSVAVEQILEMATSMKNIDDQSRILDIGTGTGVVVDAITGKIASAHILATDMSPAMLAVVEAKRSKRQLTNTETQVVDANVLTEKLAGQKFSHVFGTFVLQFLRNCAATVKQIHDIVEPGGVVALSVWGRDLTQKEIWWRACQSFDPSYELPNLCEDPEAPWEISSLAGLLENLDFKDIQAVSRRLPAGLNAEAWDKYWFESNSPAAMVFTSSWHGDMVAVRKKVKQIIRDEYRDGEDMVMQVILVVARRNHR